MLLEFKVSNYRSIGEEQILSFVPAENQKDYPENIFSAGRYKALNVVSIYGKNASGKSNLLKAMSLMGSIIRVSARTSSTTMLPFDPFQLREGWQEKPAKFEISFVSDENRYRYGFEYKSTEICNEWLFRKSVGREVLLFQRENDVIDVSSGYRGSKKLIDAAVEATRNNSLFLSTSDMLNIEEAKAIFKWFENFNMLNSKHAEEDIRTISLADSEKYYRKIKHFMKTSDMDLHDIEISAVTSMFNELMEMPADLRYNSVNDLHDKLMNGTSHEIYGLHKFYDSDGKPTKKLNKWDFYEKESSGTKKALTLSGPLLWVLENGGILIIDDIEASMHPILVLNIIELFLSKESNINHAQLIFATHNTSLLTYSKLRRDQILFTEKNKWESTALFSLSDFVYFGFKNGKPIKEKERPDTDKEKRYLEGRYGAIPTLSNFRKASHHLKWHEKAD